MWGIGEGQQIRIVSDHWIPSTPPQLLDPIAEIPAEATVKCLMNEELSSWIEENVRAFFRDDLASEILQIPISHHGGDDFPRWPFTKFGDYTVRSGYNLLRSARFTVHQSRNGRGESSNRTGEEKFWKSLWSITTPSKMKVVLWRLAHDCLPSGS